MRYPGNNFIAINIYEYLTLSILYRQVSRRRHHRCHLQILFDKNNGKPVTYILKGSSLSVHPYRVTATVS